MNKVRIALANLRFPATPEESVILAENAIQQAAVENADIVCFPEAFVPGYRRSNASIPAPDAAFLDCAWERLAVAAARCQVAVVLGTERIVDGKLMISTLVIDRDGTRLGFQDKVQLDPSEDGRYTPGKGRHTFRSGPLTFGVAICHEGWRYPETVRWAARRGAQVVFHPHLHEFEPGTYIPSVFGDPANSFHENAIRCRAAENTCFSASVNYASAGSPTTSAIAGPDGTIVAWQPYGSEGLLVADLDLSLASGMLAGRCRSEEYDVATR